VSLALSMPSAFSTSGNQIVFMLAKEICEDDPFFFDMLFSDFTGYMFWISMLARLKQKRNTSTDL
jgi:hypothetical protein